MVHVAVIRHSTDDLYLQGPKQVGPEKPDGDNRTGEQNEPREGQNPMKTPTKPPRRRSCYSPQIKNITELQTGDLKDKKLKEQAREENQLLRTALRQPHWPNRELCVRRWTSPPLRSPSHWTGRPAGRTTRAEGSPSRTRGLDFPERRRRIHR